MRNKGVIGGIGFMFLWILSFVLSIGFIGVIIWAVISLVNYITSQG